jgi:uncharacterized membrane protein
MKAILLKIKHEAMKALPPTVFFFIILHIVAVIRALMMKGTGVSLPVSASVLIASLVVVHYLERLYEFWQEAPSFSEANNMLWNAMNWPQFWAVQILLVTLIFMYCVFSELARAIGKERLKKMFLGPLPVDR